MTSTKVRPSGTGVALVRGVSEVRLRDGSIRYVVTHGSDPRFVFKKCWLVEDAIALKLELKRWDRRGEPYPDPDKWLATRHPQLLAQASKDAEVGNDLDATQRGFVAFMVETYGPHRAKRSKRKGNEGVRDLTAVIIRWLEEDFDGDPETLSLADMSSVDGEVPFADLFVDWLSSESYDKSTASRLLRFCSNLFVDANRRGYRVTNPFEGLKPIPPATDRNRHGRLHSRQRSLPWSWDEIWAIASLVKPIYRIAVWIVALTGIRPEELMGLRICDWSSAAKCVRIVGQRDGLDYADVIRTFAGTRVLPVGEVLAELIDRYILTAHGERPVGHEEGREYDDRFLIRGATGGAMDMNALRRNINEALTTLGLSSDDTDTYVQPVKQYRKSLNSKLRRAAERGEIPNAANADYLGHNKSYNRLAGDYTPAVNLDHYDLTTAEELRAVAAFVDLEITQVIARKGSSDLLRPSADVEHSGTVSWDEALETLGRCIGRTVESEELQSYVGEGRLDVGRSLNQFGREQIKTVDPHPRVDEKQLLTLGASIIREEDETVGAWEAAALLRIHTSSLLADIRAGKIPHVLSVQRRNVRGVAMPGAGVRVPRATIESIQQDNADRWWHHDNWLSCAEAGSVLGAAAATVRGWLSDGRVDPDLAWTDPVDGSRWFSPETVDGLRRFLAVEKLVNLGTQLGVSAVDARALVKVEGLPHVGRVSPEVAAPLSEEVALRRASAQPLAQALHVLAAKIVDGSLRPIYLDGIWHLEVTASDDVALLADPAGDPFQDPSKVINATTAYERLKAADACNNYTKFSRLCENGTLRSLKRGNDRLVLLEDVERQEALHTPYDQVDPDGAGVITITGAMAITGWSHDRLWRAITKGTLRSRRVGNTMEINRADLDRLIHETGHVEQRSSDANIIAMAPLSANLTDLLLKLELPKSGKWRTHVGERMAELSLTFGSPKRCRAA